MRTLVTGATGLIGQALLKRLEGEVVVLSRDAEKATRRFPGVKAYSWAAEAGPPPVEALEGVDAVFNLAGEPVADARWTTERKERIRLSRVLGTRNLVSGIAGLDRRPRVLVSASAVGYYGDRGDEELDETAPRGAGFLADVCQEWEAEAQAAERLGVRVVRVRTGIVLAPRGGTLEKMLPLFRKGLGGRLGSGRQWMPWVHIDDEVGILLHAAEGEQVAGPVNAVAPRPVRNAEFSRALGRALGRPAILPVPRLALRLAFGQMSEILTASQRVVPRQAERTGYVFRFTDLDRALADVVRGSGPA